MTDHVDSTPTANSRKLRFRFLLRAAGLTAVIGSGWCCWLACTVTPPPQEIEAYHDWNDDTPALQEPQPLADAPSRRLTAEITEITPTAAVAAEESPQGVVYALQVEDSAESSGAIEVIRHVAVPSPNPARASGAWLTGLIDDEDLKPESPSENLSPVPAWKRTSKSAKRLLREASSNTVPRQ